jgi:hypothetical protein
MARSNYIYLVYRKADDKVAAAFTVKYESQTWAAHQPGGLNAHRRTRMADGGSAGGDKTEQKCPWEPATGFNVEGAVTGRFQS